MHRFKGVAPARPEEVLAFTYGPAWRVPDPAFHFDHDPVDVRRSYRYEQGFTFELNLSGVSDELRDAFVDKRDADTSK